LHKLSSPLHRNLEAWEVYMTLRVVLMAGLAIIWVAKPAFPDSTAPEFPVDPTLEQFRLPGGDYYRFPPGYLWENDQYNFSLLIPEGAEGCSKSSIMNSHGQIIGPVNMPCPDVMEHPAASTLAGCTGGCAEPMRKQTLIEENCGRYRVRKTDIVVDGQSFLKCWGRMNYLGDKMRYMDYFTYSEPNPGLEFHVYIFCPFSGNCTQWVAKWERIIFENLHIHWQDGKESEVTNGKVKGQSK